jgi:hypothetical protein
MLVSRISYSYIPFATHTHSHTHSHTHTLTHTHTHTYSHTLTLTHPHTHTPTHPPSNRHAQAQLEERNEGLLEDINSCKFDNTALRDEVVQLSNQLAQRSVLYAAQERLVIYKRAICELSIALSYSFALLHPTPLHTDPHIAPLNLKHPLPRCLRRVAFLALFQL